MNSALMYLMVSLALGAVSCFFGKRLYFAVLMVTVFLGVFVPAMEGKDTWQQMIPSALGGLALALLARLLYRLGVFLLGALAGAGLGTLALPLLPGGLTDLHWAVVLPAALALGFCALRWCGGFIMLCTAWNGAAAMAPALCFLVLEVFASHGDLAAFGDVRAYVEGPFVQAYGTGILAVTLVLALAGFLYQRKDASEEI